MRHSDQLTKKMLSIDHTTATGPLPSMIDKSPQSTFRPCADNGTVSSRIACTGNVRVEFLRCEAEATVCWSVARAEVSLMWVRDKGSNAWITVAGRGSDRIAPGRAHFWFFPEGVGAEGELTGKGAYDCAGVSVDPSFLPPAARQSLGEPIAGFSCHSLRRAFSELAEELTESDEVLPLFTEGWAMQVLAHVARASSKCQVQRSTPRSGLAPWQLRRAKEMFLADLSESQSLQRVAEACRLSVSHFARSFKASTGVPPHQWVMAERIRMARHLLVHSPTPLVDVASMCGFSDQSHFSRVFAHFIGTSPGVWRRDHLTQAMS